MRLIICFTYLSVSFNKDCSFDSCCSELEVEWHWKSPSTSLVLTVASADIIKFGFAQGKSNSGVTSSVLLEGEILLSKLLSLGMISLICLLKSIKITFTLNYPRRLIS